MSKASGSTDEKVSPSKKDPKVTANNESDDDDDDEDKKNGANEGAQPTKIGIEGQEIPLHSLNPNQLQQLRQQVGIEINALKNNLGQLQVAGDRFRSSADCLSMYKKSAEEAKKKMEDNLAKSESESNKDSKIDKLATSLNYGPKMLVPMSQSVFIDGYVSDIHNRVLVDVGTGYYVEKEVNSATEFMNTKVENIQKNATQLSQLLKKKEGVLEEATNRMVKMQRDMEAGA